MHAKIESLTTTTALTKEDLSICRNALFKAQEANLRLLNQLEIAHSELSRRQQRASGNSEGTSSTSESSTSPTTSAGRSVSKVLINLQ